MSVLEPRLAEDMVRRLRYHLESIAAGDWDYFAVLRYRTEGTLAVSDLARLESHMRSTGALPSTRQEPA